MKLTPYLPRSVNKFLFFRLAARISMYERIAAFLESTIDIANTLTSIRDRYQKRNDYRAEILTDWLDKIRHGATLEKAIKPWVAPAEHMLIAAGERGDGLAKGLREATVLSIAASKNINAIVGGVANPLLICVMLCVALVMFQTQLVPTFKSFLPIDRWPSSALLMYHISKFMNDFWPLLLLSIGGLSVLIGKTMGSWVGPVRQKFDYLPPWSMYKSYQASSFMIGLASLMRAGVPSYEALKVMYRMASPWLQVYLIKMMGLMKLGGPSSGAALNVGLLDEETAGDVEDYSRLSGVENAIYKLGAESIEKGVQRINVKMNVVRNVLLVLAGFVIIMTYLTSFNLQTTVTEQIQNTTR